MSLPYMYIFNLSSDFSFAQNEIKYNDFSHGFFIHARKNLIIRTYAAEKSSAPTPRLIIHRYKRERTPNNIAIYVRARVQIIRSRGFTKHVEEIYVCIHTHVYVLRVTLPRLIFKFNRAAAAVYLCAVFTSRARTVHTHTHIYIRRGDG